MKRNYYLKTATLLAVFISSFGLVRGAGTQVSGSVSGTWTKANSPYTIVGSVKVEKGQTLVIEPGTQIILDSYWESMKVEGSLIANATATDSIRWKATKDNSMIVVLNGNCSMTYNSYSPLMNFYTQNAQLTISNSFLPSDSVLVDSSTVTVSNSNMKNSVVKFMSYDANVSTINVKNNIFTGNGSSIIAYSHVNENTELNATISGNMFDIQKSDPTIILQGLKKLDLQAFNNIFVAGSVGLKIDPATNASITAKIYNNTFFNTAKVLQWQTPAVSLSAFSFSFCNNIMSGETAASNFQTGSVLKNNIYKQSVYSSSTVFDNTNIATNPIFNFDNPYMLMEGSRGIDEGDNSFVNTQVDYYGRTRIVSPFGNNNKVDIGAVEGVYFKGITDVIATNGITNNTGAIHLFVDAGVGPYKYEFLPRPGTIGSIPIPVSGPASQSFNNLAAGSYTLRITDAKGVVFIRDAVVGFTQEPYDLITATTAPLCQGFSRDIMLNTNPNIVSYKWNDNSTNNFIVARTPGKYRVTATFKSGMTAVDSITAVVVNTVKPGISGARLVSTNSSETYSLATTTPNYQYTWQLSTPAIGVSKLGTNNTFHMTWGATEGYDHLIVFANSPEGCSDTSFATIQIKAPVVSPLVVTSSSTPADGITNLGGAIDLTVSGGIEPYSYVWNTQATSQDVTNLPAGTYSVTVTDAKQNSVVKSIVVDYTKPAVDLVPPKDIHICGDQCMASAYNPSINGSFKSLIWDNGSRIPCLAVVDKEGSIQHTVEAIYPSGYTVKDTVTVHGHVNKISSISGPNIVTVGEPSLYILNFVNQLPGLNSPYNNEYDWFISDPQANISKNENFGHITWNTPGMHTISVRIINSQYQGCPINDVAFQVLVKEVALPITISATTTPANGITNLGGAIDLTVSGGAAPYSYVWNTQATSQDLTNLPAGTYSVTVYDANQKSVVKDVVVEYTKPAVDLILGKDIHICGDHCVAQSYRPSISGTYKSLIWDNGDTLTPCATVYIEGVRTHTVIALFPSGYTVYDTVNVHGHLFDIQSIVGIQSTTVDSKEIYEVRVYNNKVGVFTWETSDPKAEIKQTSNNTVEITWHTSGNHSITVKGEDIQYGCNSLQEILVIVKPISPIVVSATTTPANGITNLGGAIDLTVSGGTAPYTYVWSNNATTQDVTNLPAGTYSVTVYDANQKSAVKDIVVEYTKEAFEVITPTTAALCQGFSRDIMTNPNPNIASYKWNDNSTLPSFVARAAGKYYVTATFKSGMTAVDSITAVVVNTVKPGISGARLVSTNSTETYTLATTTPNYQYTWKLGSPAIGTKTDGANNTAQITWGATEGYDHLIVFANSPEGCSDTSLATIQIKAPVVSPLVLTASATPANGITNLGGAIDLTVSGGTAPYTYVWSNNATTQDVTNLPAGIYTVTVTDANQKSATIEVVVGYTNEAFNVITETEIKLCKGSSRDVMTNTNQNIASYKWNDNSNKNFIVARAAGKYSVTATFKSGMTVVDEVSVTEVSIAKPLISGNQNASIGATEIYSVNNFDNSLAYNWQVSDDSKLTNNKSNASIVWAGAPHVAKVMLTVSDVNNCRNADTLTVEVATPIETFSILGTVRTKAGEIVNTVVTAYALNDSTKAVQTTETNANGSFQFTKLPEGSYKLYARPTANARPTFYMLCTSFAAADTVILDGDAATVHIILLPLNQTATNDITANIEVFPNPTQDVINFKTSDAISNIRIINNNGVEVLQTSNTSISVAHLAAGIYTALVETNNGVSKHNFIKQ